MAEKYRFKVDKLIRDKLPEIMRASGIEVLERAMDKNEYIKSVKDKLLEETNEVIRANSKDELIEELGDLYEMLMVLASEYKIDVMQIKNSIEQKQQEKGAFNKRIYNAYVEIESGHPTLAYYRARPEKYPEMK